MRRGRNHEAGLARAELLAVKGIGPWTADLYLLYAAGKVEFWNEESLWAMVGFAILLSTLVHGFTAGIAVDGLSGSEPEEPRSPG